MGPLGFFHYSLITWMVCLWGLLLAWPLSMRMPMRDFRPVLHRRGLYDPKHGMSLLIALLLGELVIKLFIFIRFQYGDLEPNMVVIAESYASFFLFGILWLLASLIMPKISNRSMRKVSGNTDYHKMAIRVAAICGAYVLCSYLIQRFCIGYWYANTTDSIIFTIVIFLLGAAITRSYYIQINRYDRIKDEAERTLSAIKTRRAPIIFLRSFELDKNIFNGYTFDEFICQCFSQQGQPIISLSDPDDFLPTGGSIKLQSFDDNWKEAIVLLLKNCRAVVIFEGRSEGLSWEISKIRNFVSPDKLFVATPPKPYRDAAWFRGQGRSQLKYTLNYVWSHFVEKLHSVGIEVMQKEEPGADMIFVFDNNWKSTKPIHVEGIKFFDTILERTTHNENMTCDYISLSEHLRKCELTRAMTKDEGKLISKKMHRVMRLFFLFVVIVGIAILLM